MSWRRIMYALMAVEVAGAVLFSRNVTEMVSEDGIAGLASMLGSIDWGRILSMLLG